jgi:hypothetical protein
MPATRKGAKKFTKNKLAQNPNYFSELAKKGVASRAGKHSGSFQPGESAATAGAAGGKISKRGKAKVPKSLGPIEIQSLEEYQVDYIEETQ